MLNTCVCMCHRLEASLFRLQNRFDLAHVRNVALERIVSKVGILYLSLTFPEPVCTVCCCRESQTRPDLRRLRFTQRAFRNPTLLSNQPNPCGGSPPPWYLLVRSYVFPRQSECTQLQLVVS